MDQPTDDTPLEIDVAVEDDGWRVVDLDALAQRAVRETLSHLGLSLAVEVAVLGCGDERIATLNADFRGRDRPTNVLSWPSAERGAARDGDRPAAPCGPELGDVAIASGVCAREAAAAGVPMADHVLHLLVHATLHLLGYDHERPLDAALMEGLEAEILARMGLPDPYSH